MALHLARALRHGYSDEEIMDLFRQQGDFDSNTCRTQISSVDPEKTAACKSITELGYCLPNCSFNEESGKSGRKNKSRNCDDYKPISSPGIVTTEVIFEQLKSEAQGSYYAVWNRIEQKIQSHTGV